ncbi:rCG24473 [Rattus norvegicus]|uniref:RCG24473 n=1 Tax=Rattus norvegicus TaxID=10116 RepID=A6KJ79_RAT|nr:rCG24473 [Rattus norvegicus]
MLLRTIVLLWVQCTNN